MIRQAFIERALRQIYGDQPRDDSSITINLVNNWLGDAIAYAAKQNYKDNIAIDGIGYLNNSFYTTFKGLTVTQDEQFKWKLTLPQIPVGVGRDEGVSTLKFKDTNGNVSQPCIPLTASQTTYFQSMRPIPNKTLYFSEGTFLYALSTILLSQYTASVTMVSGGDDTDLNSVLNVPPDYFGLMTDYIKAQLLLEQSRPRDQQNDGIDNGNKD